MLYRRTGASFNTRHVATVILNLAPFTIVARPTVTICNYLPATAWTHLEAANNMRSSCRKKIYFL